MQMFQKGRSMIEMLGVLAIIGVLSIGGLLGYRRAVNNHQANVILDDVNRFAFVILESNQAFEPYNNITGLEFTQTSPYFMNAFTEATSQQFAIMVTNVPKGVCEALLPKASVEYKVRTLAADTVQEIDKVSLRGKPYDSENTDICDNINDVVLYFGDVSKHCTHTGEKECTSYADCCYGEFCAFPDAIDCHTQGTGKCAPISAYAGESQIVNNQEWTHSTKNYDSTYGYLYWWGANDWCQAQGKQLASLGDLGCGHVSSSNYCTKSPTDASTGGTSAGLAYKGSVLRALQDGGWSSYAWHWLRDNHGCSADDIGIDSSRVYSNHHLNNKEQSILTLCH